MLRVNLASKMAVKLSLQSNLEFTGYITLVLVLHASLPAVTLSRF